MKKAAIFAVLFLAGCGSKKEGLKLTTTAHSVALSCSEPTLPSGTAAVTSFNFYRGASSGGESATPLGSAATCAYTDTAVTAGTTYFYTSAAVNSVGTSPMSNEVSATIPTPPAVPPAPTGLTGTAQ
jgi:hypothetical protein